MRFIPFGSPVTLVYSEALQMGLGDYCYNYLFASHCTYALSAMFMTLKNDIENFFASRLSWKVNNVLKLHRYNLLDNT